MKKLNIQAYEGSPDEVQNKDTNNIFISGEIVYHDGGASRINRIDSIVDSDNKPLMQGTSDVLSDDAAEFLRQGGQKIVYKDGHIAIDLTSATITGAIGSTMNGELYVQTLYFDEEVYDFIYCVVTIPEGFEFIVSDEETGTEYDVTIIKSCDVLYDAYSMNETNIPSDCYELDEREALG